MWWTAEVRNQEFWFWHLRSNVFRILVTREDPNLGRKSMIVLHNYINSLRHVWVRFYHPQNWGIYRLRWLPRLCGLHYPATWAKRFWTAKFSSSSSSSSKTTTTITIIITTTKMQSFVGMNREMGPDSFHTRFLRKQFTCWTFCFAEAEETPVTNRCVNVWKLP